METKIAGSKFVYGSIFVGITVLQFNSPTYAETVMVNAVSSGYYKRDGVRSSNQNTAQWGDTVRDFLAFDMSTINGWIVGATLEISSHKLNTSGQTISWWDVTTPSARLGNGNDAAIFNDLGGGILYSQGLHQAGALNAFALNSAALASLNATDLIWAIGGQMSSGTGYAFGYQNALQSGQTIRLVLDVQPRVSANVPENSSTLWLLGMATCGVFALGRNHLLAKQFRRY